MTSLAPANRRRRPGSMSSPIRRSASRRRPKAAATHGPSTVARTSSPRGRTIRSAIAPAKRSICETMTPAISGVRRRCRSATRGDYVARHGRGYSRFEHGRTGSRPNSAIRARRRINQDIAPRADQSIEPPARLSVTAYVEWALGPRDPRRSRSWRRRSMPHRRDVRAQSLEYGLRSRVAFADLRGARPIWTGDRREFIGRNGALAEPAGLAGRRRSPRRLAPAWTLRRDAHEAGVAAGGASKWSSFWVRPRRRRPRGLTALSRRRS